MHDLTHVDEAGSARMVDVSAKSVTERVARAAGSIRMRTETLAAIRANGVAKGDVLTVAKVAGIMGAKRTAELVPLCHPLGLTDVRLTFEYDEALPGILVESVARASGQTGVEMEAMTATAVALITIYDMAKAIDREMVIGDIRLLEKSGGKSGHWAR